jgi:signal transduction histidine kinase
MPDAVQPWADTQADADAANANMAIASLAARLDALQRHVADLEAQLAARTRALAEATGRLQAEAAARDRTAEVLHQTQKLQAAGHLAGGIAHDFNNTLAIILGNLELMERCLQGATPVADPAEIERLYRFIERAMEAVQHGAQVTILLQAFSRRQSAAARPTDLNRLIGELTVLAGGTLGRGVLVRRNLADDLWPVFADAGQLGAALLALCLNARDAMPEGGELRIATANARVTAPEPDGLAPGEYVRVAVGDTGTGMAQDVLARAFEPFFSTKGPTAAGLGLTQVHALARQIGGVVRASSTCGLGTEILLLLPRAPHEPDASS